MTFDKENLFYKYIGIIALVSLVIYLVIKTFNFQENILEGFESSFKPSKVKELEKHLTEVKESIKDKLLVSKYREEYETLLLNIEELAQAQQLSDLLQKSSNGKDGLNISIGNDIDLYKKIREGAKESLEYLDSL